MHTSNNITSHRAMDGLRSRPVISKRCAATMVKIPVGRRTVREVAVQRREITQELLGLEHTVKNFNEGQQITQVRRGLRKVGKCGCQWLFSIASSAVSSTSQNTPRSTAKSTAASCSTAECGCQRRPPQCPSLANQHLRLWSLKQPHSLLGTLWSQTTSVNFTLYSLVSSNLPTILFGLKHFQLYSVYNALLGASITLIALSAQGCIHTMIFSYRNGSSAISYYPFTLCIVVYILF